MTEPRDRPQITLVTPPELELSSFPDLLLRTLDTAPVACLRLALSTRMPAVGITDPEVYVQRLRET